MFSKCARPPTRSRVIPLILDPVSEIRQVINWSPDAGAGLFDTSAENASSYYEKAAENEGGLASLTVQQRTNLIVDLMSSEISWLALIETAPLPQITHD